MIDIVPFSQEHIPLFTTWFNALPDNDVWDDGWIRAKSLDDPQHDPELMVAALRDGEPAGFLLAIADGETAWIKAFLVHPGYRRQGIASAMFDAVEETMVRRGIVEVHVGWALPRYLWPGIDVRCTPALVFLERRGYESDRVSYINMDVHLAGRNFAWQEARLLTRGIAVRRALPADRNALVAFCRRHGFDTWAVEVGMALEHEPPTAFLALKGGRVCAFAVHSVVGPIHFGPMLTAPDLRGMGIGSTLLRCCLQEWQRAGIERCEIVWAGPLSFYARVVGATVGRVCWRYRKNLGEK